MGVIQSLIELLSQIVDKFGTKFAIAALGVGLLGYLEYYAAPEASLELHMTRIIGIVILGVAYFIARRQQESEKVTKPETPTDGGTK